MSIHPSTAGSKTNLQGMGSLKTGSTSRILVVDNEPGVRDMLRDTLDSADQRCDACADGAEAYVRMRSERFDVILSNARLPEIDGFQLLDMVAPWKNSPKFVLMGEQRNADTVRSAFKRGAFDFLSQPLDMGDVRNVVSNALISRGCTTKSDSSTTLGVAKTEQNLHTLHDPETGLMTRTAFCTALERMRSDCHRDQKQLSILVFEAQFNGSRLHHAQADHAQADHAPIRRFSRILRDFDTPKGVVVRIEHGRFVMGLFDAGESVAFDVAEQIRRRTMRLELTATEINFRVRLGTGIATSSYGCHETSDDLVERGLAALTRAGELGGDATVRYSELAHRDPSRRQITVATAENLANWIRSSRQQLKKSYLESTLALVAAVEAKEPYTQTHSEKVARYCQELAGRMNLSRDEIESVRTAALLHDIGKIGVPDAILRKPGPLTDQEFEIIKRHPQTAVDILRHTTHLQVELPYILHHHERFDGSGYPVGLSGQDIPIHARIINVADAIEAMRSKRSYKNQCDLKFIATELQRCSGGQFDPDIVDVALDWIRSTPEAPLTLL